jgi:23S rRNA U2552 (ribose-2'-O)-methylase RlmE/FtsJ
MDELMKEDEFLKPDSESQSQEDQLPQELLNEIDLVLGEAVQEKEPRSQEELTISGLEEIQDYGLQEMHNTFLDLISNNLSPLTRYVKAFTLGANYETVLELCDLLISPLLPRLKEIGLNQHLDELTFFKSVLHFAKSETDPKGREVMKSVVYRSFKELQKRFHLSYRGSKVAVKNLISFLDALKANPEISEEIIQRFFAIGVPSLTWVRKTSSEELTSLSGIPVEMIRKIRVLAKEQKSSQAQRTMSGGYRIPAPDRKIYSEDDVKDSFVISIPDEKDDDLEK